MSKDQIIRTKRICLLADALEVSPEYVSGASREDLHAKLDHVLNLIQQHLPNQAREFMRGNKSVASNLNK